MKQKPDKFNLKILKIFRKIRISFNEMVIMVKKFLWYKLNIFGKDITFGYCIIFIVVVLLWYFAQHYISEYYKRAELEEKIQNTNEEGVRLINIGNKKSYEDAAILYKKVLNEFDKNDFEVFYIKIKINLAVCESELYNLGESQ